MAFDDHPKVDESSKISEDSVFEVKRIFKKKMDLYQGMKIPTMELIWK